MEAIAQWLKEKGKIVIPKTLDTQVFDENGKSLDRRLKTAKNEQVIQLPKVDLSMIFSDLDYSTEEQLTGKRWIDEKPIYQKTFVGELPSQSGAVLLTECGIPNIEKVIDYEWMLSSGDETSNRLYKYTPWFTGGYVIPSEQTADHLEIYLGSNGMGGFRYKYTCFYTKTTDTADSPVAKPTTLHNYSTEEKVVGTWNDKPLYEKTFFAVAITNNTENFVSDNFGDRTLIHFQPDFNGMSNNLTSSNNFIDTLFINDNNQLIYYFFRNSTWWEGFNTVNITVQYTKTTDTATI